MVTDIMIDLLIFIDPEGYDSYKEKQHTRREQGISGIESKDDKNKQKGSA